MDSNITIREQDAGVWSLEFSYNEDYISYLKSRVPPSERTYDSDTRIWRVWGDSKLLAALEGIAVQKFTYAVRWFRNADGKLAMKNLKNGVVAVQEELFEDK
jgi:hypothetical protein